jgi:hypothetical protein
MKVGADGKVTEYDQVQKRWYVCADDYFCTNTLAPPSRRP